MVRVLALTVRGASSSPAQSYIPFTHCYFSCLLENHIIYKTLVLCTDTCIEPIVVGFTFEPGCSRQLCLFSTST